MPKLTQPTVVAFLQNMWFRQPERMKAIYQRYVEREEAGKGRQRFIRDFLFFGCLTGRRLDEAFEPVLGDRWRWMVTWEEAHPGFAGNPSTNLGHDVEHMVGVIKEHRPQIVMLFGAVAAEGWNEAFAKASCDPGVPWIRQVIRGPHPAARHASVRNELREMALTLKESLQGG